MTSRSSSPTPPPAGMTQIRRGRIFLIMTLALMIAAASVAGRAVTAIHVQNEYLNPIDRLSASEMLGSVLGTAFAGFSITLFVASPLLHVIGMRRALISAALLLIGGLLLVIGADGIGAGRNIFHILVLATLLQGVGWGLVEAVINPLTSALYPADKAHRLNVLHAWYPAGIVLGSLLGLTIDQADLPWRWFAAPLMIGAAIMLLLAWREPFPSGDQVTEGVGMRQMFREIVRNPAIFLWFGAMTLTATTEFAPGQWVDFALSEIVGMRGILLLVYVSALMFVMRHFAGVLLKRVSNITLLLVCSAIAAAGLFGLSTASGPASALLAATAWGVGVAFYWPTMLATVAERYPRGGTLVYGLMGSAGAAATYLVLPVIGRVYDNAKIEAAGGADAVATLSGPSLLRALEAAATASFQAVAAIPVILVAIFGAIAIADRRRSPLADPTEKPRFRG